MCKKELGSDTPKWIFRREPRKKYAMGNRVKKGGGQFWMVQTGGWGLSGRTVPDEYGGHIGYRNKVLSGRYSDI